MSEINHLQGMGGARKSRREKGTPGPRGLAKIDRPAGLYRDMWSAREQAPAVCITGQQKTM
jgi:hypothetical protein